MWCSLFPPFIAFLSALPLKCYRCAPLLADVAVASVFADHGDAVPHEWLCPDGLIKLGLYIS